MAIMRLSKKRGRKPLPEHEKAKGIKLTDEGRDRLFRLIRSTLPDASDDQCLEILWLNTDVLKGAEYKAIKKQLEEYLFNKN